MKVYAVRRGRKVGIYKTWAECKEHINGYSGAEYKSFLNIADADAYIKGADAGRCDVADNEAIAYVDGSYDTETNRFSCGVVLFYNGEEQHYSEAFSDTGLASMRNVAGEIKGAEMAIQHCLDNGINFVSIYHDYEGIEKWCTGAWQAKKPGTQAYKEFYDIASKTVSIRFIKVKGHSGDKYNDMADMLAKMAIGKASN